MKARCTYTDRPLVKAMERAATLAVQMRWDEASFLQVAAAVLRAAARDVAAASPAAQASDTKPDGGG